MQNHPLLKWLAGNRREITLLILTALICLIALEAGLRVYYELTYTGSLEDAYKHYASPPAGSNVTLGQILRPSPNHGIIYELKPNLDVNLIMDWKPNINIVPFRTNSFGLRDGEFRKEKGRGVIRIVGVGDSYMFGWGVNESDRYMDVLERRLNRDFPQYRWETMVFAAPGYNLKMEVEVLKQYALDYDPDLIIYGFCGNDACLPTFISPKRSFFSGKSMLAYYLRGFWQPRELLEDRDRRGRFFYTYCGVAEVPDQYKNHVGTDVFIASLKELGDVGRSKGIPVVYFSSQRAESNFSIKHESIRYVDSEGEYNEYLRAHSWGELQVSSTDPHPSPKGHELLADALYNGMTEQGILGNLTDGGDS